MRLGKKHGAKALARQLNRSGVPTVELHGNLGQGARTRNLDAFHSGKAAALVATDIAARGIHVDDISLVVHADPPAEHKAYLHRSGRTARAGNARHGRHLMTSGRSATSATWPALRHQTDHYTYPELHPRSARRLAPRRTRRGLKQAPRRRPGRSPVAAAEQAQPPAWQPRPDLRELCGTPKATGQKSSTVRAAHPTYAVRERLAPPRRSFQLRRRSDRQQQACRGADVPGIGTPQGDQGGIFVAPRSGRSTSAIARPSAAAAEVPWRRKSGAHAQVSWWTAARRPT
jgi:superfamily II DNA/RNA helicase